MHQCSRMKNGGEGGGPAAALVTVVARQAPPEQLSLFQPSRTPSSKFSSKTTDGTGGVRPNL